MTSALQKLTEPKTALEQLQGVYEYVMQIPLVGDLTTNRRYILEQIHACALCMFRDNDTDGYRAFVIRNAIKLDCSINLQGPPYEFTQE